MDTSRVDGVKAPQHRGTPRAHLRNSSFFESGVWYAIVERLVLLCLELACVVKGLEVWPRRQLANQILPSTRSSPKKANTIPVDAQRRRQAAIFLAAAAVGVG